MTASSGHRPSRHPTGRKLKHTNTVSKIYELCVHIRAAETSKSQEQRLTVLFVWVSSCQGLKHTHTHYDYHTLHHTYTTTHPYKNHHTCHNINHTHHQKYHHTHISTKHYQVYHHTRTIITPHITTNTLSYKHPKHMYQHTTITTITYSYTTTYKQPLLHISPNTYYRYHHTLKHTTPITTNISPQYIPSMHNLQSLPPKHHNHHHTYSHQPHTTTYTTHYCHT